MLTQTTSVPFAASPGYFDQRSASAKTGLHLLMAAMSSMFFLFLLSYILRSQVSDWEALSEPWQPLAQTGQLWFNTALLVVASISLELARRSIRQPERGHSRELLMLAGLSSIGFLVGQLVFWNFLTTRGFFADSNPANAFFFLLTGLHAVHLVGGLVAWIVATVRLERERREPTEEGLALTRLSVELCATYWHFLLVVWMLLFALLSSSPGTYAAIAKFCGLGD
ncbi:MAG: cytochrome c oxidase subunit 3 [Proteobacteria bacterium]|jgi:cytochrome c oxidase subunit 3|nr:cytochrome c oxidase subunit 3 [Pseudomonadota bacterium]MDA1350947.1 cytochrome c oxidase subunit 3 [Pseudomonadota bacterium]